MFGIPAIWKKINLIEVSFCGQAYPFPFLVKGRSEHTAMCSSTGTAGRASEITSELTSIMQENPFYCFIYILNVSLVFLLSSFLFPLRWAGTNRQNTVTNWVGL